MDNQAVSASTSSEEFYRYFQRQSSDITTNIDSLGNQEASERAKVVEACQASITRLSKEVQDASSYVPARDRRIYGEGIRDLQQKLKDAQAAFAPKQKFSFKAGRSRLGTKKDNERSLDQAAQPALHSASSEPLKPPAEASNDDDPGREGEFINLTPDQGISTLSNLRRCVVNITSLDRPTSEDEPLPSLTLKNISDSIVLCSKIDGPIHLTNISNSMILVWSRQFRMHESHYCDVYVRTSSRPIIEYCSHIRFAPFVETYAEGYNDMFLQVDDFNWHRNERSPNWSELDILKRADPAILKGMIRDDLPVVGVEEILRRVGLPGNSD